MGAPGWRMVSQAFRTLTSWIALREIFLLLDLSPKVDTNLRREKSCVSLCSFGLNSQRFPHVR